MARRDRSSSGPPERPRRPPRRRPEAAPVAPATPRRWVVYGRNPVHEAIRGPREVRQVWASERAADEPWLRGVRVTVVPREKLEQLAGSADHQGICAEVSPYRYAEAADLLAVPDALIVALDEVTDPQNLGAVCRTAECVGATGVVLPERRAAEVNATVCKVSAGAVEHLAVAQVRNLADFLAEAKSAGCWCYGAAAGADTPYLQPDYHGGVVLVLGAEGKGLRPRVARACDALVSIPLRGRVDSLNVGATAAVLLYGILQRRLDTAS